MGARDLTTDTLKQFEDYEEAAVDGSQATSSSAGYANSVTITAALQQLNKEMPSASSYTSPVVTNWHFAVNPMGDAVDVVGAFVGNATSILGTDLAIPEGYEGGVDVDRFLRSHPSVFAVLVDALPHVRSLFGGHTSVRLRLVKDPDADSDVDSELFADIKTGLGAVNACRSLDVFDDNWFLDNLERTQGLLNFTLEFR